MLKHAIICRTKRAQSPSALTHRPNQWEDGQECKPANTADNLPGDHHPKEVATFDNEDANNNNNNNNNNGSSQDKISDALVGSWLASVRAPQLIGATNNATASCCSSPTPSTQSNNWLSPSRLTGAQSSAPSSVFSSPNKNNNNNDNKIVDRSREKCENFESTIRLHAQMLNQNVEYITLYLNEQTKSQQIVRTLLRKFRLKHRDPNLFFLTLERWIRKDGLKCKSVMVLSDDACPLQLQQCCSSPPHNDIKFTLEMRPGALIKIFCQEVLPSSKYKCLSLSRHTTAQETIELMLHCLNITPDQNSTQTNNNNSSNNNKNDISKNSTSNVTTGEVGTTRPLVNGTSIPNHHHHHTRQASSPESTNSAISASSTASSTTSSSGIESDPTRTTNQIDSIGNRKTIVTTSELPTALSQRLLDANSRTSSVTSISSSTCNITNATSSSSSSSISDNYCLAIECEETNFKRILDSSELLVDVYQKLLDEVAVAQQTTPLLQSTTSAILASTSDKLQLASNNNNSSSSSSLPRNASTKPQEIHKQQQQQQQKSPDQWFVIKLKRRDETSSVNIKFANPRRNMPLPPIPLSLAQSNNANNLQTIVSTTRIEVNTGRRHHRPSSSLAIASRSCASINARPFVHTPDSFIKPHSPTTSTATKPQQQQQQQPTFNSDGSSRSSFEAPNCHKRQMSAIVSSHSFSFASNNQLDLPKPPASQLISPGPLIWMPQVKPRRRNLSNASSTFGRSQQQGASRTLAHSSRRRYDPAQLAEDLIRLNLPESSAEISNLVVATNNSTSVLSNDLEPEQVTGDIGLGEVESLSFETNSTTATTTTTKTTTKTVIETQSSNSLEANNGELDS